MLMPRKQNRGASADEKREKISAIVSMRSLMSPTGMGEVVVQVTFDHVACDHPAA